MAKGEQSETLIFFDKVIAVIVFVLILTSVGMVHHQADDASEGQRGNETGTRHRAT